MTPAVVTVSPDADVQILERFVQIARHSPHNALRWEARLRAFIDRLGIVPGLGAVDPDGSKRFGLTLRRVVFEGQYLLFYVIESSAAVQVVYFRHGARRPGPHEP